MKGRYQVYFERARIPIAAVDGLGRVRESNPAFRSAVARTVEELDGIAAEELLAPGEIDAQRPYWRLLAFGRLDVYRTRMRLVRGDGAVISARVSASVEHRADGLPWRAVAVLDEISSAAPALSPLQGEVLRLVAAGASNAQIARRLYLTRQAVDYHLVRLRAKLDAESRSALAGRAFVLGLFVPGVWPPALHPPPAGAGAPECGYWTPRN
ncbi:PAS domain S-box-containing protein [Streptosporangium becharense]|uniref:PAS domain S-box-containing protein n=1 Tax=Streptosporangium becharense TaxID=1816182 RepID=A0A7W9IMV1_9ACTN|nr:LuxR C-terminal-related transcriptional regulator [Streptosporangium becharense]MBB2914314.1 PAS domain S-box-containing protein [Streptosporangium becharense]MBB5823654.1 PAS domain S-box-containing protein [Streptosporangium becharense]